MNNIKILGENNYMSEDIMLEILKNRNSELRILTPNESDMPKPYEFRNMEEAVELVLSHVERKSNIVLIPDSDPDGATSFAILYNRLMEIDDSLNIKMAIHEKRTHGIIISELEKIGLKNIDLLIVPDGGSENYKEHKILKDLGIDVLVIDHHDVKKRSKDALVVNNNIDKIYTELSGAGMVYLLCKAIDDELWENGNSDKYLDLTALGIISDMMKINNPYNQYIIERGLRNIKNRGLSAIVDMQTFSMNTEITPKDISFNVTPLINSVFRLGTMEQKEELFKSLTDKDNDSVFIQKITRGKNKGEEREESYYTKTARMFKSLNDKRKRLGKKIVKETVVDLDNKILFVEIDEKYNKDGMSRIIVNGLARDNMKPCLAYSKNEHGKFRGSMSSGDVVENFKDRLNELDIFHFVAGHQGASGFELKKEKIEIAQQELNNKFKDEEFRKTINVDFDIPYDDFLNIGENLIDDISQYNTKFGRGFEAPVIRINNIKLKVSNDSIAIIGSKKNTLKIKLENGVELLLFFTNQNFYNDLVGFEEYLNFNILGSCSINEYGKKRTYQIIIKDIENLNEVEDEIIDGGW